MSLTAFDVHGADLDVHGVELELHLAGDDGVHPGRVPHGLVAEESHRGEFVRQSGDL